MQMENVRRLVGKVRPEDLRYVDAFVAERVALFMPAAGACFYALTPLHSHPAYMFVLPFNNQTSLRLNGRTVRNEPGRLLALSPGVEHHELPSESPPRYLAIFIEKDFFEERLSGYPVKQDVVFQGEYYDHAPELLPIARRFMVEADGRVPGCRDLLDALSVELCHWVIRSVFRFAPARDRVSRRIEIDRAVEYLHANLGGKVTLGEMARAARMSPSHFSRAFREETGKTPVEYLNGIRMERVRKLLLAGEKSITDIALECGFGSPAYLSERFSKKYGIPPSAYRACCRKGIVPGRKQRKRRK